MSQSSEAEREIRERVLPEHRGPYSLSRTLGERFDIVIDETRIIDTRAITHQARWDELAPSFAWHGGAGRDRRLVAEALAILERAGEVDRWLQLAIEVQSDLLAGNPRY
jgi:hypothetical protein